MKEAIKWVEEYEDVEPDRLIVRCKDCKHWDKSKHAIWKRCGMIEIITPYNFYCACGERRDER